MALKIGTGLASQDWSYLACKSMMLSGQVLFFSHSHVDFLPILEELATSGCKDDVVGPIIRGEKNCGLWVDRARMGQAWATNNLG